MRRIGMAVLALGFVSSPLLGQRSALREVGNRGAFGADFVVAELLGLTAGRTPIAIDIGARGVRHDRVTYVPAGGLTQNPDGSFSARQVTTPVDMRVYQIGVSIGIR